MTDIQLSVQSSQYYSRENFKYCLSDRIRPDGKTKKADELGASVVICSLVVQTMTLLHTAGTA